MRHISSSPFIVELDSDCWRVWHDGSLVAHWSTEEEDLGTDGLLSLFRYLGLDCEFEEIY
jgi:hypothetical protein